MALYDLGCNTWNLTSGRTDLSVFQLGDAVGAPRSQRALITPTHTPWDIPEFPVVMDPENH